MRSRGGDDVYDGESGDLATLFTEFLCKNEKMPNKLYDLKKELSRQIFEDATWLFSL